MNDITQTLWPVHCVQESHGAELHKNLTVKDQYVPKRRFISTYSDVGILYSSKGKIKMPNVIQHLRMCMGRKQGSQTNCGSARSMNFMFVVWL